MRSRFLGFLLLLLGSKVDGMTVYTEYMRCDPYAYTAATATTATAAVIVTVTIGGAVTSSTSVSV